MNSHHQPNSSADELFDVLLYDGLCGVCDAAVQFILAHDRRGTLRFAPLQGAFAAALMRQHPELARIDSLLLVRGGAGASAPALSDDSSLAGVEVLVRSAAVVAVGRYLGGIWRVAALLLQLLPRRGRDWGYDRLAAIRNRVSARRASCRVATASERQRFLE